MPEFARTPQFSHGQSSPVGVLLVNLGTPDAPTAGAVRRFLKAFLSDPRVVEYPRLPWWLVLNLVILNIRPRRSAAAYKKIWTDAGSPLMVFSQALAGRLSETLQADDVATELAMTYGEPSISAAVDNLLSRGVRRVLLLPLYPQYSGTTTAAVTDAFHRKLAQLRWVPEVRTVTSYHDHPRYIAALADSVRQHGARHDADAHLLMSFHGVPKSTLDAGDPYFCHCQKTARLLAESLQLDDAEWSISFQSRVGRQAWLQPYTEERVRELGANGTATLDVICPGFATDCLETLEEIEMQNAEAFRESGGETLRYIPALNDSAAHVDLLASIVRQHTDNWDAVAESEATRTRAVAMGAAR